MIAIIDYNAGNLTSVARALSHIGYESVITHDINELLHAERIIFPGVGAAGSAMDSLRRQGLDTVILDAFQSGKPILGICLGTQIIMNYSEENHTPCLGIVEGITRAFQSGLASDDGTILKIPHMGWNQVELLRPHPVLSEVCTTDEFYFVHGYYPDPKNPDHILGLTNYGVTFASIVGYRNIIATQFHLEKSGRPGLKILENFCKWQPC
ncbi:MAG: imidazole glycerol phosphate synthase subunit HisH [Deltaproteobacteria bacterium]|nr:imidazole glycerol phosphate synthase subunit HisH [Deltaproteobacteria bacterium]MBW1993270.1 imidazole glycerol phosphate synthase subunit HisH [Deltaproteobacteria bacterium]MBW2152871.1 imidazole glycerol phosphate synthase subunit HisH [Deltaproteobacteria bacterium]